MEFEILEVIDSVKHRSEVKVGAILKGGYTSSKEDKRVFYMDSAQVEWVFYPGDTCRIIKS